MSKTWSYTRVPPAARAALSGRRAGRRKTAELPRYSRAPALFPALYAARRRAGRRVAGGGWRKTADSGAAFCPFLPRCDMSHTCQPGRRASPVRGGIRAGVRGPGRRDRGPRSTLGGWRYVSGRARAAGRGRINAQKKPRGVTPGASCAALGRF